MHKDDIPTIGLYRLVDPLGVIEGKQGRGNMRDRLRPDYGMIAGALVLVGLLALIIWSWLLLLARAFAQHDPPLQKSVTRPAFRG